MARFEVMLGLARFLKATEISRKKSTARFGPHTQHWRNKMVLKKYRSHRFKCCMWAGLRVGRSIFKRFRNLCFVLSESTVEDLPIALLSNVMNDYYYELSFED